MNSTKEYHVADRKLHKTNDQLVWCGRKEGFLSIKELVEETNKGIEAYAKMQPLRFRSAMRTRIWPRAKHKQRTPLRLVEGLSQPRGTYDGTEEGMPPADACTA